MKTKIKTTAKKIWSKSIVRYSVVLVAGLAIGSLVTHKLDNRHAIHTPTSGSHIADKTAQKQFTQEAKERLEQRYKQVQGQLSNDVKTKQLTQKQADTLKKKLEEAYKLRIALDITKAIDRQKLQDARVEWRKWAKDNNVSYRYFVWLY